MSGKYLHKHLAKNLSYLVTFPQFARTLLSVPSPDKMPLLSLLLTAVVF